MNTLLEDHADREEVASSVLAYLAQRLPGYPFRPDVDEPFVAELLDDFQDIDVLEEIKAFRWYYENQPLAHVRNPRVALRRWIAKARSSQR